MSDRLNVFLRQLQTIHDDCVSRAVWSTPLYDSLRPFVNSMNYDKFVDEATQCFHDNEDIFYAFGNVRSVALVASSYYAVRVGVTFPGVAEVWSRGTYIGNYAVRQGPLDLERENPE